VGGMGLEGRKRDAVLLNNDDDDDDDDGDKDYCKSSQFLPLNLFVFNINYYINIVGCKTFQHHWQNMVPILYKTRMTRLGPVLRMFSQCRKRGRSRERGQRRQG